LVERRVEIPDSSSATEVGGHRRKAAERVPKPTLQSSATKDDLEHLRELLNKYVNTITANRKGVKASAFRP
jgi:hypothetical protein